jgi:hypothetical protein
VVKSDKDTSLGPVHEMISLQNQCHERVHLFAVPGQAAGRRQGPAAGGAGAGAVDGMGEQVCRQVAGLAADGALKDELAPRPTYPLLLDPAESI